MDNSDILFVAGDIDEDFSLDGDEAISILADNGQVRQHLHKKALGRGFFKIRLPGNHRGSQNTSHRSSKQKAITDGKTVPPPPAARFNTARPKMWNKAALMARAK